MIILSNRVSKMAAVLADRPYPQPHPYGRLSTDKYSPAACKGACTPQRMELEGLSDQQCENYRKCGN